MCRLSLPQGVGHHAHLKDFSEEGSSLGFSSYVVVLLPFIKYLDSNSGLCSDLGEITYIPCAFFPHYSLGMCIVSFLICNKKRNRSP